LTKHLKPREQVIADYIGVIFFPNWHHNDLRRFAELASTFAAKLTRCDHSVVTQRSFYLLANWRMASWKFTPQIRHGSALDVRFSLSLFRKK
jgi:hypothetical protein